MSLPRDVDGRLDGLGAGVHRQHHVVVSDRRGLSEIAAVQGSSSEGSDFRPLDHVGKTAVFAVLSRTQEQTKFGAKSAVRADVTVIEDDGTAKVYTDILIFSSVIVRQIGGLVGQSVVTALDSFESKSGNIAPKLGEPTLAQVAAAERLV
ncbi:hypothetical protein ACQBAR_11080 [Propionibacteriaceae bacterium Y1685]|uniref:hypothetical protein n=1 Tax=Microlunatus sp. Y1700 TaxID=3418487 RepID=UPI003B8194AE